MPSQLGYFPDAATPYHAQARDLCRREDRISGIEKVRIPFTCQLLSRPNIPKPLGLDFGLVGIFRLLVGSPWTAGLPSITSSCDCHGNDPGFTSMLALKPNRARDEWGRFSRSCWTWARLDSTGAASGSTSILALKPSRALEESGLFSRSCWTRGTFDRSGEAEPATPFRPCSFLGFCVLSSGISRGQASPAGNAFADGLTFLVMCMVVPEDSMTTSSWFGSTNEVSMASSSSDRA